MNKINTNQTHYSEGNSLPKTYNLMLAVAYYNLGIEYEHIKNINEAITSMNHAFKVSNEHLGSQNPLTLKIMGLKRKLVQK